MTPGTKLPELFRAEAHSIVLKFPPVFIEEKGIYFFFFPAGAGGGGALAGGMTPFIRAYTAICP